MNREIVMTGAETVRNVAFVGPNGSGKTTLLENLLYVAGAISRKGKTTDGTTVGDASQEARNRHMGVEVNAASFDYQGLHFTILDCPGSVEFVQEARNALLGIDAAVVVVEPVPERMISIAPILNYLDKNQIPHLVFINKMDRSEVRYRDLLDSLRAVSDRPVVPHQYAIGRGDDLVGYIDLVTEKAYAYKTGAPSEPIELPDEYQEREQAARQEMLETLADFDDDLMELLLEDQEPPADDILRHMQNTLGADQIVPVFMGVAEQEMGARRLLEALVKEAPAPTVTNKRLGIDPAGETIVQIIKTYHLPHAGKLSLARVWAGEVKDGMTLTSPAGDDMRLSGVFKMFGNDQKPIGNAGPGEIVGLGRLDAAKTADILLNGSGGDPSEIPVPRASPLKPMYAFAVSAENRNDEVKMSGAFSKLVEEDPSLRFEQDPELHQSVLWGQGEMHLRVALDRLRSKYHVDIKGEVPETPYRETIKKSADSHGRHKKQSGGHGQFGDVKIKIDPKPAGAGFEFVDKIVGGAVPRQYIPAVEAGAKEFLQRGPLGFPVVDVGVTLYDGQFHSVDSSEIAFKMATALALKEGLPQCHPVLLEPILTVNISVPSDYTSKVLQIISGKRGQILGYDGRKNWRGWDQVQAHIPQAEIHDLIIDLRSSTQGVGFFDCQHDHFQQVPDKVAETVVAKRQEKAA
ncbi:MAG: elongation factor G [Pseudomonadota bacterium]